MSCRDGHFDRGTEAPRSPCPCHGPKAASTTHHRRHSRPACAMGCEFRSSRPTEVDPSRRAQLQRFAAVEPATHRDHTGSALGIRRRPVHIRAAVELSDTSHGVRCLSTESVTMIVECRIASPTPSALRVSHPLSGFIPSSPRGFISRHIRPQAFGLQSLFRAVSRDISRCPLLSCRFSPTFIDRRICQLSPASASEPCSNRAVDTLREAINTSSGRCSPDLSPLRGLPIPVTGREPAPHVLHMSRRTNTPSHATPQGMSSGSGDDSEESPQPP